MTISKKNQASEESVGNAPYYRTSSPLDDRVQQAVYSTKHLLAAKDIKKKEMEIVQLNVQDPTSPVGCPVMLVDPYQAGDHGNSHNREMLPGSKITDCFGSKGVVVKVVPDESLPASAAGIMLPRNSILQSVADEIINIALEAYGKEQANLMIDNKHAPLDDAIRYILNQVDDAGAMYIERAIGEQYGLDVLNKTKAAKAKRMESIKAARSAN